MTLLIQQENIVENSHRITQQKLCIVIDMVQFYINCTHDKEEKNNNPLATFQPSSNRTLN